VFHERAQPRPDNNKFATRWTKQQQNGTAARHFKTAPKSVLFWKTQTRDRKVAQTSAALFEKQAKREEKQKVVEKRDFFFAPCQSSKQARLWRFDLRSEA